MKRICRFAITSLVLILLFSCASLSKSGDAIRFEDMDRSGFVPCSKTDYVVSARRAVEPTVVYNNFEDTYYDVSPDEKDRIILTGVVGEEWVTKLSKVLTTYTNLDGSPLAEDQIPYDGTKLEIRTIPGSDNYAMFVPRNTKVIVTTAWGDILTANRDGIPHGDGDWIICRGKDGNPDFSDVWVVNGAIFPRTYELK